MEHCVYFIYNEIICKMSEITLHEGKGRQEIAHAVVLLPGLLVVAIRLQG